MIGWTLALFPFWAIWPKPGGEASDSLEARGWIIAAPED